MEDRLGLALQRRMDRQAQHLDRLAARIGRLSGAVDQHRARLSASAATLQHALHLQLQRHRHALERQIAALPRAARQALTAKQGGFAQMELRIGALDPALVLQRGYVWLADAHGTAITRTEQIAVGQAVHATLADGTAELSALSTCRN